MNIPAEIESILPAQAMPYAHLHRLSVDQYHRIVEAGILTSDDRIELLQGILVEKMGKKPQHSRITQILRSRFEHLLPPGWHVIDQEPLTTHDSEPEPDIMIVRGAMRDYMDRHPAPADVALIIEVSDATLSQDRALKMQIYAAAGIPTYWILNLVGRQLEVHTDPYSAADECGYRDRRIISEAESASFTLEGHEVARFPVSELLP
ncbi:MAG: Uma2 family endonuclease [Anaerolineae bacterium]|nr:Uma2 family endonuclease [Anaerolineae bacterium]